MKESRLQYLLRSREIHRKWIVVFLLLAIMVTAGVSAALHKTGVAAVYTKRMLQCPYAEMTGQVAHIHAADCYDEDGNLVCPLQELAAHTHTPECYTGQRTLICGLEEDENHAHSDACYEIQQVLICEKQELEEHVHDADCFIEVELTPEEIAALGLEDDTGSKAVENEANPDEANSVDETIKNEDRIIPAAEETGAEVLMPAVSFDQTTGDVRVIVEADEGVFPAGTSMEVNEIETDDVLTAVTGAVDGKVMQVKAVDIIFRNTLGEEIQPLNPIRVRMEPVKDSEINAAAESAKTSENENFQVVHVDDEGKGEVVETAEELTQEEAVSVLVDNAMVFDADHFSVYAFVYTVYYEYEVNGQTYASEVPGAQDVYLSELISSLYVVDAAQVPDFMSKIQNVSVSNPDVVMLTPENGDWVIRPVKSSDVPEALTITMQDGAVFSIRVDAKGSSEVTSENNTATISTVNDFFLPENASAYASFLTDEQSQSAIAAVQASGDTLFSDSQTAQEPIETPMDSAADSVLPENTEASESAEAPFISPAPETEQAADADTVYQVFDIGLNDVEQDAYEDGFRVDLTLPEAVRGTDFRLFHLHDDLVDEIEFTAVSEILEDGTELVHSVSFVTPSFSEFVLSCRQLTTTVISDSGETWEITVSYDVNAGIPENAVLQVREILPGDDDYAKYLENAAASVNGDFIEAADRPEEPLTVSDVEETAGPSEVDVPAGAVAPGETEGLKKSDDQMTDTPYARFFDIEIHADGQKIEPASPVNVRIRLLDAPQDTEATPKVVHFASAGPEVMTLLRQTSVDTAENSETVGEFSFLTKEFSVYSVIYTVDFSFEVDGQVYSFSMKGEDAVSLRSLLETLHVYELADTEKTAGTAPASQAEWPEEAGDSESGQVAEQASKSNPALDKLMNSVTKVTFSDPSLLAVVPVEKDATLGELKAENHITQSFSLVRPQKEVVERNAVMYSAGDWVLISLRPFTTDENLQIVLATGESFTINVTDAQNAVMNPNGTVQTISNPAGTTIDLFDYWVDDSLKDQQGRAAWPGYYDGWNPNDSTLGGTGNNAGINQDHALKFSPAWEHTVYNGTKDGGTSHNVNGRDGLNSYTGNANPFQGIVAGTMQDGYPVLTENGTIGSNGKSLAYLFDPSAAHSGKASYSGVDQLMYVDTEGYYTYDSRDYAAAYNPGTGTFTVTPQTSTNTEVRGFWPFGTQTFWSGLHINTQFSMPAGGQVLNPSNEYRPMQFEFSGDDDTWLYVDGVLVGDGGGIHNRTEIDINFAAGTVSVTGRKDSSHAGNFEETRYLDDIFKAAGAYKEEDWEEIPGSTHKRFKAGTYHTFDMFYLERGGGESNLYIHYNLVSTADFTAHKSFHGTNEEDLLKRDQFQFELIGLDGKYRSVPGGEAGTYVLQKEDDTSRAIMPRTSAGTSGAGTVASPYFNNSTQTEVDGQTVNSQTYRTGVTEDGNINFGTADISENDMHDADTGNPPVYKYIIREIVPDDAVNEQGKTWAEADDEERQAGGFVKDDIIYDGTIYYMTGRVTSWTETDASGQEVVRHGLSKTYYTDDTYTTVRPDTPFVSFVNAYNAKHGNVEFTKTDQDGNPLEGATFALFRDEECKIPAKMIDLDNSPWTNTSGENGKVAFENVRVGTYYMKETSAPEGYALIDTVYKVIIEDSKDKTRKSKITILGDEEETVVTEIANAKAGRITVIKKWLNASGTEVDGGGNSATVWLKRKHMVAEGGLSGNHNVTVQMTVEDGGVQYGTPVTQTVTGSTVVIEWDDEWQRNFNWSLSVGDQSYEGWIGDEYVRTDNYTFEQISVDGRSRRLTIFNASGDISFTTKYWVSWLHSDPSHWSNLNNPVITGSDVSINYVTEEDAVFNAEKHTQSLSGSNRWSQTWSIGGSASSHSGFDFPAIDDEGRHYLYYIVELDSSGQEIAVGQSPQEGYVLQGYSANNNTGVASQGVLTVYNQLLAPQTIDIVVRKTDNAENSTNYLEGAVFRLEYRADSSGSWVNVPAADVEQLDAESRFTVPKEGITLTGLKDGQYRLHELTAPAGYVISEATPVIFTVSAGSITSTEGTITGVRYTAAAGSNNDEFIIPNTPGVQLPQTGGIGTGLYTALGGLMTVTSGAILTIRRKKKA